MELCENSFKPRLIVKFPDLIMEYLNSCGYCFGQFVGNGTIPCKSGDYCSSGRHTCDDNAKCTVTGKSSLLYSRYLYRYHGKILLLSLSLPLP